MLLYFFFLHTAETVVVHMTEAGAVWYHKCRWMVPQRMSVQDLAAAAADKSTGHSGESEAELVRTVAVGRGGMVEQVDASGVVVEGPRNTRTTTFAATNTEGPTQQARKNRVGGARHPKRVRERRGNSWQKSGRHRDGRGEQTAKRMKMGISWRDRLEERKRKKERKKAPAGDATQVERKNTRRETQT
jgi:hypothetical protein